MIAVISAGVIAIVLWWEERPLRDIEAALDRQEYAQALEMADRYLRESPSQVRAVEQKARALAGLGRWADADRLFEQIGPISIGGHRAWAKALLHEQRWIEALPLLVELTHQLPDDADLLHELAGCQGKLGYYDDAIRAAEKLVKIPANERRGRLLLGMLQNRRGNNRLAIQAWAPLFEPGQSLDDLQVTPTELRLEYGRVLLNDGRPAEALPQLEEAVATEPNDEACLALAEARDSLGNTKGAVEMWSKVVESAPSNAEAREGLARAALERKAPAEARQWLKPLLERDDLRSSTAHLAQRTATLQGNKDEAAQWEERAAKLRAQEKKAATLEQAMRESPSSFWSQCIQAHRFATAGNLQQAQLMTIKLLKQKPDEPFVKQLAEALSNQTPLPSLDLIPLDQH
jgi:tetratricopeptide (TPR) repeat protein